MVRKRRFKAVGKKNGTDIGVRGDVDTNGRINRRREARILRHKQRFGTTGEEATGGLSERRVIDA